MNAFVDGDRLAQVARLMHAAADMVDDARRAADLLESPAVSLSDLDGYRSPDVVSEDDEFDGELVQAA